METFRVRASCAGKLLTDPRDKKDELSQTTVSYLQEWLKTLIYGVKKDISNKYLEKGIEKEDEAIDKAVEWLDLPFSLKNEKSFENEYFTGTPDLIVNDIVYDIKNSWDCFTFPLFENECPNKDYYAQLQVYMHLTGLKKAALVYVLLDTPETYSTPEIKYDGIDKKYRIKRFDFDYDEELINKLIQRVKSAREYIKTIAV
jgi:hypothetical protein